MDDLAVPADLATALLAAGYRIGGPAGVGSGGPVWTAVRSAPDVDGPPDPGDRVVVQTVTVPDGVAGEQVVARLEALWSLEHPHLARVVEVLPVDPRGPEGPGAPERWAVLLREVPGATVAALLAARGRLSAGEVSTLTVPIAGALDALHRAGLVHGDVSPANVVVRTDGCPVLIDLLGAVRADGPGDGGATRRGTPGFTAPELARGGRTGSRAAGRSAGDRPGRRPVDGVRASAGPDGGVPTGAPATEDPVLPPDAPADVFSLASVALAALDLAASDGRLGQELRAALAPEPIRRPTAAELAAACFTAATPETIVLPDAGVLARTTLAQLALQPRTLSAPGRSRHRARRDRRARRRRVLVAASAAVALVVCVLTFSAVARDGRIPGGRPDDDAAAVASPGAASDRGSAAVGSVADRPDPVEAAVALTRRRAEVLAAGDPAGLDDVAVPGSRAHAADRALLDGLATTGVRLDGVAAVVEGGTLVGDPQAHGSTPPALLRDAPVEVRVGAGLTAHRRVSPTGVVEAPAEPVRTVVLRLVWTADGWRVEDVAPG